MSEVIVKYWPQITLVLTALVGLIGYFGKRYYDLQNKIIEVKHSLFQTQKITAINNFLLAYTVSENFWSQVSYFDVKDRKYTAKQMDEMTLPIKTH